MNINFDPRQLNEILKTLANMHKTLRVLHPSFLYESPSLLTPYSLSIVYSQTRSISPPRKGFFLSPPSHPSENSNLTSYFLLLLLLLFLPLRTTFLPSPLTLPNPPSPEFPLSIFSGTTYFMCALLSLFAGG